MIFDNHFCLNCLEMLVGKDGSNTLLKFAEANDLPEDKFFLLLTAAELAYQHETGEEFAKG